jgi:HlyD family secretion protein
MRISPTFPSLLLIVTCAALSLLGCSDEPASDAYGNFEATEVTVSAQSSGRLQRLDVREGARLRADQIVGLVDTTALSLRRSALDAQRSSLQARRAATRARVPEIDAEVDALQAQLETAITERDRTRRLHDDGAATARELNQREGEVRVLRSQVRRAKASIQRVRQEIGSLTAQVQQIEAQIGEINTQLRDAHVVNPVPGTVLSLMGQSGETVSMGTPLYSIANLDTLDLRAYATGAQLPRIRLNMQVDVLVDAEDGGVQALPGTVVHVASDAQFTPTPIQTRDNRAELVYAFDVRVPNPDGRLKIGMPGEVRFPKNGDDTSSSEEV